MKASISPFQAEIFSTYEGKSLIKQVQHNHHINRSGDIYVIQNPYWFMLEEGLIAVMHGSPWRYDTHVPVIFSGPGIKPQQIQCTLHPVDVAPTMATLLGMTAPVSIQGMLLTEVINSNAYALFLS